MSLTDPGIPHSERNTTQTRRWTFGQIHASKEDERSEFSFVRGDVQKPIISLGCLATQEYWMIFALTLAHCTFQTAVKFHHTMKAACFFVKGKLISL